MNRKHEPPPMTAQEWLDMANEKDIRARIEKDPYSMVYPALLSHFSRLTSVDWDAALLGLHIVYGWMPTIPKLRRIMKWDATKRQVLVEVLTCAKEGSVPDDLKMEMLKTFSNNSVIGASKLLHFLRPDTFPIWDSRVAKAFLKDSKPQWTRVNEVESWRKYRDALMGWLLVPEVRVKCCELRGLAPFLKPVVELRLVELVMFHRTKSNRDQEEDDVEI